MNKHALTLAILLALGNAGCAGFALEKGSSFNAALQQKRGLDNLWSSGERASTQGREAPLYAEQELGDLWNRREKEAISADEARLPPKWALGSLRLSATIPSKILAQ